MSLNDRTTINQQYHTRLRELGIEDNFLVEAMKIYQKRMELIKAESSFIKSIITENEKGK